MRTLCVLRAMPFAPPVTSAHRAAAGAPPATTRRAGS